MTGQPRSSGSPRSIRSTTKLSAPTPPSSSVSARPLLIVQFTKRAVRLDSKPTQDGQGRAVKIIDPLPWHEPVDGDRLASTLAAAAKTYLVLSDIVADTIALWVMHTWAVNVFTMSPRLAIVSPTKGCGKTTLLRFLNHVARRAKRAGSISPPALFRAVEQFQPTVLLDETEKYVEHGGDLHALLNEGHCKGGSVWRVLGEKQELREFSVFGALAFARNGRLPDDLEQRSIVIEMQRRRADEVLPNCGMTVRNRYSKLPRCVRVGPMTMQPSLPITIPIWK